MEIYKEFDFHDDEIIGVFVDRKAGNARIELVSESGQSKSVRFSGLKALRCEDLTLQNVVSRVLRSSNNGMSREDNGYWLRWVTSFTDSDSWLSASRKEEWLDKFERDGLELLVFEPSAGAQIVVVCEKLDIIKQE